MLTIVDCGEEFEGGNVIHRRDAEDFGRFVIVAYDETFLVGCCFSYMNGVVNGTSYCGLGHPGRILQGLQDDLTLLTSHRHIPVSHVKARRRKVQLWQQSVALSIQKQKRIIV